MRSVFIIAPSYPVAKHYAELLNINYHNWTYVSQTYVTLRGMVAATVIVTPGAHYHNDAIEEARASGYTLLFLTDDQQRRAGNG